MNAFDKVIGYETIKNGLLQICDMIHNREVYEELGAKLPQGDFAVRRSGSRQNSYCKVLYRRKRP